MMPITTTAGDRLILGFTMDGIPSGHAPVVCIAPGDRTSQVVRVTRQDHDGNHTPTHYRRITVAATRLRRPTPGELADESVLRIWTAIERARMRGTDKCSCPAGAWPNPAAAPPPCSAYRGGDSCDNCGHARACHRSTD